jgi:protein JSN1
LKIINQRSEPEARDQVLQALFFTPNDQVLDDILSDQSCGATLIFKVLTTPFFDEKIRSDVVATVRNVLLRIKAQPAQGYKRLMDEVGLSTRNAGSSVRDSSSAREPSPATRPGSKQGHSANQANQAHMDNQMNSNRQMYSGMPQAAFDPIVNLQRTGSMDSNGFEQVPFNGMAGTPMFQSSPNMQMGPITPQQIQYQQTLLANAARQTPFYPIGGFPNAAPPMEGFRNMPGQAVGPSPLMPQSGFVGPGFNPVMGQPMYPYPVQYVAPQQTQHGGGNRRGRR